RGAAAHEDPKCEHRRRPRADAGGDRRQLPANSAHGRPARGAGGHGERDRGSRGRGRRRLEAHQAGGAGTHSGRPAPARSGARAEQLGRRTDAAFGYLHDLPPLALEEARLQRDVTIAEQLFTTVQQSYNQTQLAAVSTLPDVRILDRATPPDRPDRTWTPLLA